MSTTLRIGFIGVEGAAFALAADPQHTSAIAVIFSAIEQLRRYYEKQEQQQQQSIPTPEWLDFMHELADANEKDYKANNNDHNNNDNNDHNSNRQHAKHLIERKIAIISETAEKHCFGSDLVQSNVDQVFYQILKSNDTNSNNNQSSSSIASSSSSSSLHHVSTNFFWLDLLTPSCRIHISVGIPSFVQNEEEDTREIYHEILDNPLIATWKVDDILRHVSEQVDIHPHDLEVFAVYPELILESTTASNNNNNIQMINNSNVTLGRQGGNVSLASAAIIEDLSSQQQQQPKYVFRSSNSSVKQNQHFPISRSRPLLDVVRTCREVQLRILFAKAPVISIRVVEAATAEYATRIMYSKMMQKQLQESGVGLSEEVTDPYVSDPISVLENASKRVISVKQSNTTWSTTLGDLHTECNKTVSLQGIQKGRGFLCLNSNIIQHHPESIRNGSVFEMKHFDQENNNSDKNNFNSRNHQNQQQQQQKQKHVPVYKPEMTIRELARLLNVARTENNNNINQNSNNNDAQNSSSSASAKNHLLSKQSLLGDVRLFLVVTNSEKTKQALAAEERRRLKKDRNLFFSEVDDVRYSLMDAVFPQWQQTATSHDRNNHHNNNTSLGGVGNVSSRLKRQNIPNQNYSSQQQNYNNTSFAAASSTQNSNNNNNFSFQQYQYDDKFQHNQQQQQHQHHQQNQTSINSPLVPRALDFQEDDFQNNNQNNNNNSQQHSPISRNNSHYASSNNRTRTTEQHSFFNEDFPQSPSHTEGVECFISVPVTSNNTTSGNSGSEVLRLLLPDGYFPLRRLRRFLKLQAEEGGAGVLSPRRVDESTIFHGENLLKSSDLDLKSLKTRGSNVIFLSVML